MPGFFDDQTLSIPCQKCGHETEQSVSRLKTDLDITCGKCGVTVHYDATEFREGLSRADKAIDDFWKSFS